MMVSNAEVNAGALELFAPAVMRTRLIPMLPQGYVHIQDSLLASMYERDPLVTTDELYRNYAIGLKDWENALLQMCLYSDTIYVPKMYTAVATDLGFFYPPPGLSLHAELRKIATVCDNELSSFYERIRPLIENNIIKLYDPYYIYYDDIAYKLFGTKRWMTEEEIKNSWPDLFVAEGILFSEKLGATYTAITSDEINAIRNAGKQICQLLALERDTIAILAKISIPGFSADPKALVKARLDHEAFDDFRSTLRNLVRHMRSSLDSNEFDDSVDLFQKDVINPQLSDLIRKCKRTHGLGENIKANAISFAAGGFSSLALSGDPATAVTAGALTALARAILQQLLAKKTAPPAARFFNQMIVAGQPNINVSRKWRSLRG